MNSRRGPEPPDRVDGYVFGVGTVSPLGYTGHGLPRMFGSRSRAGWAHVNIVIVAIVSSIMAS
ncbi:hypothetical protein [Actinoplanes sp. NPDC049265]|uniref:hypothetical protein n=1 Tax=Actinoplanes sp. NPDC049265 TaxID=3363902 RepID=UPI0037105740